MSKRVQIAVIREANLNAKPTETHYLAEGGLQISRKDAVALKGTTLYYTVMVDLGVITGSDFILGRDVPVYLTDSDPVLAFQPQLIRLVDPETSAVEIPLPNNGIMFLNSEKKESTSTAQDAQAKRRPGRPRKNPIPDPIISKADPEPVIPVVLEIPDVESPSGFEGAPESAPQDDESTFLIPPTGAPARQDQPEFSFDVDEDEEPPPPEVLGSAVTDFVVEDDPEESNPDSQEKVENILPPQDSGDDDYSNADTGMFDE